MAISSTPFRNCAPQLRRPAAIRRFSFRVTPLQFADARVRDASLIPVMDKVKVVANEEFESLFPKFQPSRVTITTVGGRTHATRVDVPKGDPRDPMTRADIAVKFKALSAGVLEADRCDDIERCVMALEEQADLRRLISLLAR